MPHEDDADPHPEPAVETLERETLEGTEHFSVVDSVVDETVAHTRLDIPGERTVNINVINVYVGQHLLVDPTL